MKSLILLSVVCMQLGWGYGYPAGHQGVGAYAYQDSAGNRYGGTYGLPDSQVFGTKGDNFVVPFGQNSVQDLDDFFPEYFRNFENLLQEAFGNHIEQQKVALDAARKAYDLTSNQAGYIPNLNSRYPVAGNSGNFGFGGLPGYDVGFGGLNMPGFGANNYMPFTPDFTSRFGQNSAYAGAFAGPGFTHQVAAINPMNPETGNIDVTNFADTQPEPGKPKFYSVQSSSYSSSSNLNGQQSNQRGAETVVNNNGKVTKYKVNS